mgnify:CR=1 FL=1
MKYILLVILLVLLGCEPVPCVDKVILKKDQEKTTQFMTNLLGTVKVTTRNDDEDVEDWMEQAQRSAMTIYGTTVHGFWVDHTCDCSVEINKLNNEVRE